MNSNASKLRSINVLNRLVAEHARVLTVLLGSVNSSTLEIPIEVIMAVALQRSRHLTEGFIILINQGNLTAAGSLTRMQLDSCMRVNACFLVDDPLKVLNAIKANTPLKKLHSKSGQELSDRYLHEELSKRFSWVSSLYSQMSSYIHMSTPHLNAAIEGNDFLGMKVFTTTAGARITDKEIDENRDLFVKVTELLFSICELYAQHNP